MKVIAALLVFGAVVEFAGGAAARGSVLLAGGLVLAMIVVRRALQ